MNEDINSLISALKAQEAEIQQEVSKYEKYAAFLLDKAKQRKMVAENIRTTIKGLTDLSKQPSIQKTFYEKLIYKGKTIRRRDDGTVNASDLWTAEGKERPKRLDNWIKSKSVQEQLEAIASKKKVEIGRNEQGRIVYVPKVLETVKGGSLGMQGTWLSPELGKLYAEYLSIECGQWFEETFRELSQDQSLTTTFDDYPDILGYTEGLMATNNDFDPQSS